MDGCLTFLFGAIGTVSCIISVIHCFGWMLVNDMNNGIVNIPLILVEIAFTAFMFRCCSQYHNRCPRCRKKGALRRYQKDKEIK